MDRIFMILKRKLTPGVNILMHVYGHYSQRNLLVYISGERLQDHWSSGLCIPSVWCVSLNSINSSDSEFLASNQIVTRFRLCP